MNNADKLATALREFMAKHGDTNCVDDAHCAARHALAEFDAQTAGFTVFLREADGTGTTHISYHPGDRNEAVRLAMIECRADWGWEEHGSDEDDDLHVLGVAAGDVTIVEWDD